MKKQIEQTPRTEEGFELKLRARDSKPVTIHIPADALASLEKIAAGRDMSVEALLSCTSGNPCGRIWRNSPPTVCWRKPLRS